MLPPRIMIMSDGRIQGPSGKWFKPYRMPSGYLRISTTTNGKRLTVGVHQLVCEAFHGPKPTPDHQVCHNDGNPANNAASNLRWGTSAENHADKKIHGTDNSGERAYQAKLTWAQVREIRTRYATEGMTRRALATEYGVHAATLTTVLDGRTWVDPSYTPPEPALLGLEAARSIREQYAAGGVTYASLAADYELGISMIGNIIRNVNWPDPGYTPPPRYSGNRRSVIG